jgi:hypothetical protein
MACVAEAETAVADAQTRRELAERACTTLDGQLRDSHALRDDLVQQRDRLQALCDRQIGEIEALKTQINLQIATGEQERERDALHVRAIEDRAHQEVDRSRQETKQWQQRLASTERTHRDTIQALASREAASRMQLQAVEKESARLAGQVSALETSLAKAISVSRTRRTSRPTPKARSKGSKDKVPKG